MGISTENLSKEKMRQRLAKECLSVAKQFPGLSVAGFFSEVWWRFYPRIDENDVKGEALRMVSEGELSYTINYKVYAGEEKNGK